MKDITYITRKRAGVIRRMLPAYDGYVMPAAATLLSNLRPHTLHRAGRRGRDAEEWPGGYSNSNAVSRGVSETRRSIA